MPTDKRTNYSEEERDALLEPLRENLQAGMTDDEASRLTGVPVRSVQRWRLLHGLKKPKGLVGKQLAEVYAISTLGEALGDVRQRTRHSPTNGTWEPPMFVVREHLDYDLFLRLIDTAHRVLGLSPQDISKALGVSLLGVEQGLALYERHLHTTSKKCMTCDSAIDPSVNSNFCTKLCERIHYARPERSA